jgi:hypothetical protein
MLAALRLHTRTDFWACPSVKPRSRLRFRSGLPSGRAAMGSASLRCFMERVPSGPRSIKHVPVASLTQPISLMSRVTIYV